jgi:hypothetical protein
MLTELVGCGALITSPHAPGTATDALTHLARELRAAGAGTAATPGAVTGSLAKIRDLLERHNGAPEEQARRIRHDVVMLMQSVAPTRRHPLAID